MVRAAIAVSIVLVACCSLPAQLIDEAFFWEEVIPSWRQTYARLSMIETEAKVWENVDSIVSPQAAEPIIMRFFLRDGMQKLEWPVNGEVQRAFGSDTDIAFHVGRSGPDFSGPMAIRKVRKAGSASNTGDPLLRYFSRLFAPMSVQPGRALQRLRPGSYDVVDVTDLSDRQRRVTLNREASNEEIILTLDKYRDWAIVEWQHHQPISTARGLNAYFDDTQFGPAVPKFVRYEVFDADGRTIEASVTEFSPPVTCDLPAREFTLASFGLAKPAIPEPGAGPRTRVSPLRRLNYLLPIIGVTLVVAGVWLLLRRRKQP